MKRHTKLEHAAAALDGYGSTFVNLCLSMDVVDLPCPCTAILMYSDLPSQITEGYGTLSFAAAK